MSSSTEPYWRPSALAQEVGLAPWQLKIAEEAGMLPQPGHTRGWLPEQVPHVREAAPTIIERFGTQHPVGAARCAERLARRLDREVLACDIEALAEAGHLQVVDVFTSRGRSHELFSPDAIDQLATATVAETITVREHWRAASVSADEACARLGWTRTELQQVTRERELTGRFGRYERATIDALAEDDELCARVEADRLITADQAADRLDVARRHFDIAAEAGWVIPQRYHEKQVGRYRTVDVPLYRTGDADELLARHGTDWEAVRATGKGERSPLLEQVGGRAPSRAAVIRAFLRDYGAEHHIEMWGWWVPGPDVWEIDWERHEAGPSKDDVAAAITENPVLAQHQDVIQLSSQAGAAVRFARTMLEPDTAVILDTETTDLENAAVCEIAVIDACTGRTLLDTLVNPGVPIEPGAQTVHGITEAEVSADGVPDWQAVYRRLLRVTRNRTILAYNAVFDRGVIAADCARVGIRHTRLTETQHWADVMLPRSDHAHSRRWLPNGGGHRALGDVQQTRQHLQRMTAP